MKTRYGLKTYGRRRFGWRAATRRAILQKQRVTAFRGARRYAGPQVVTPIMVGRTRRGRFAGEPIELKFHDLDIDDGVVASGANIAQASCNLIAQGVTEVERIGRKCTIRSINWRFQISLPSQDAIAAAPNGDTIRVLLYLDKQANGAAPATTDIIESADFQSFNNLANKGRFRTLMDRTYNVNYAAGGSNGTTQDWASVFESDTFFKKVNIPIEFSAGTGAITEIRSNNIGLLLMGNTGVGGFVSKMRIRFSDS